MTIEQAKVEQFVGKVLGDMSGMGASLMAMIGERLGLFRELAKGARSSEELASRCSIHERYAREWLGGMTAAGYLAYDAESGKFSLPPEHVPVFAQEAGPFFFGGAYEMMMGTLAILEPLVEAFRKGGGVAQSAYPLSTYDGMDRFTASWFENLLLPVWIPAVPDVQAKLAEGAEVADVGCGRGRALVKLAQAFPKSRYLGIDVFGPNVAKATANAAEAGVSDRVRFVEADAARGLQGKFDVITTFDVVHDAADPLGLLRSIRGALKTDGAYLCLDINCSHDLRQNLGPLGTFFHTASLMYCLTTSLANGGAGLGTLGLHERKLQELALEAGFRTARRLPLDNPFNNLYEIRP